jgi:methylglyoxal synthase
MPLVTMKKKRRIALIAHDNMKEALLEWVEYNSELLERHELIATGTTGTLIEKLGFNIYKLKSGPLGGDQQIGSRIAEGKIDVVVFFSDPLEPMPHDPDVKALLRIAVVYNIPIACNRASADFMISSPLMTQAYDRIVTDFSNYNNRLGDGGSEGNEPW